MTWKEHFSLEQLGESESPTPSPHKTPFLAPQPLPSLCKTTSYPHLPTIMTCSFKEPLKLVKVAMPRTHPGWTSHFWPIAPKEEQEEAWNACLESAELWDFHHPITMVTRVPQRLGSKS